MAGAGAAAAPAADPSVLNKTKMVMDTAVKGIRAYEVRVRVRVCARSCVLVCCSFLTARCGVFVCIISQAGGGPVGPPRVINPFDMPPAPAPAPAPAPSTAPGYIRCMNPVHAPPAPAPAPAAQMGVPVATPVPPFVPSLTGGNMAGNKRPMPHAWAGNDAALPASSSSGSSQVRVSPQPLPLPRLSLCVCTQLRRVPRR
jgi:hypothetical protein